MTKETAQEQKPTILFACIHNSGRSVAAKVIAEHLSKGKATILSGGSEPKNEINKAVALALQKKGLSADKEYPKLMTTEHVQSADIVVTMGCGETCPFFPGKKYLDWEIEDPAGKDEAAAERVVEEIWSRVTDLLAELGITADDATAEVP
ncbi:MAG: heat-shock protein HtpX [Firmicutes bacterium]|jgi:protein-tyrosine-phosphatase|nr:heat-shock protein HtpX [Bacillota bacterium]